jgi:hypothetical protein
MVASGAGGQQTGERRKEKGGDYGLQGYSEDAEMLKS